MEMSCWWWCHLCFFRVEAVAWWHEPLNLNRSWGEWTLWVCGCDVRLSSGVAVLLSCVIFVPLQVLDVPLTVKIRTGVHQNSNVAHKLIPELKNWGVSMITVGLCQINEIIRCLSDIQGLQSFAVVIFVCEAARQISWAALHKTGWLGVHQHLLESRRSCAAVR